jgi:hypothetical protein
MEVSGGMRLPSTKLIDDLPRGREASVPQPANVDVTAPFMDGTHRAGLAKLRHCVDGVLAMALSTAISRRWRTRESTRIRQRTKEDQTFP